MIGIREQLEGLETGDATEKVVQLLTQVKGIGPGVAGIFLRRVQGDWDEVFPFADDRSLAAAKRLGLIEDGGDADDLAKLVNGDRTKLVRLLDTLVGLDLEKKLDEAAARFESS
ncbi:hypothetical protein JCM24511_09344 [Saitozyma sp. JCM 24511]|nr:hypothetical protein JCM24511_09344 [Saitozyma sp. JCM 24511]